MKIGNRTVLLSTTIMVPDGEEATLSHNIAEGDVLNCCLKFLQDPEDQQERKVTIQTEFEKNMFTFTFKNFNNSLGHTTSKPIEFGYSNKKEPLTLLAAIFKMKTFTKIELQIMLEAQP